MILYIIYILYEFKASECSFSAKYTVHITCTLNIYCMPWHLVRSMPLTFIPYAILCKNSISIQYFVMLVLTILCRLSMFSTECVLNAVWMIYIQWWICIEGCLNGHQIRQMSNICKMIIKRCVLLIHDVYSVVQANITGCSTCQRSMHKYIVLHTGILQYHSLAVYIIWYKKCATCSLNILLNIGPLQSW